MQKRRDVWKLCEPEFNIPSGKFYCSRCTADVDAPIANVAGVSSRV